MSMNLYFEDESGTLHDFPFQTPTDLTWEIVKLEDKTEQYNALCSYIACTEWEEWHKEHVKDSIFDGLVYYKITYM